MDREIITLYQYVKRKYVIDDDYVLHIDILSSLAIPVLIWIVHIITKQVN